ncbi:MAG TPA: alpha/beta hydrolase [Symbiobacteriaceae bacterium]|nr:alpha/beta hydrolase [Symbiobacteriaceae bacterium]
MFKTPDGEAAYVAAYHAALAQWPVPCRTLRVPTRYGLTHVVACGSETGEPLVLLHAAGTSSTVWMQNIGALSETYRIFLIDIPGDPNLSEPSAPFRSRSDCTAWLSDVLDGLKIDRPHLGGISYGGWQALNYALAVPDRLKSLMLFAPAASLAKFRLAFFLHFIGPMLVPTRKMVHRTFRWLVAPGHAFPQWLEELMFLAVKHYRFTKGGIFPSVYPDEELRSLRVPTLLLLGEHEVIYDPKQALDRATRLIPSLRAELIPGAGHVLIMEQPEIVNGLITDFLAATRAN